ncbi:hypothetical protein [uncultured Caballeronia sp.]|jgi:hypothetical protein|uniref:hypothetical protein n=1 Tax=uncultured Caballeronia sp. TaxID=1827198 RepID=UPI0015776975
MLTISRMIRRILFAIFIAGVNSPVIAMQPLPASVEISDGRTVTVRDNHLYIREKDASTFHAMHLPKSLRHKLENASAFNFPESQSLRVDGKDYFLVIIDHSSGQAPAAYCGAGNEGELYALRISGKLVTVSFSKLVASCLKNIELSSDGMASPYRSVAWNKMPVGIRVSWASDASGKNVTRFFRFNHGEFVETPVAK